MTDQEQTERGASTIDTEGMILARDATRSAVQAAIDVTADAVAREPLAVGAVFIGRMRRALALLLQVRDEMS